MRHFSNIYGFRGRVARLLIPISGEMILVLQARRFENP
jgi:hypothetical protein